MSKKYAIGIDIGGTNLRAAIVSGKGEVVEKVKEPTGNDVLDSLQRVIAGLHRDDISGIGIGVAGLLNRNKKTIILSPNLLSVVGIDFTKILKEKFRMPVFIENDANAAALGEQWVGAGKPFDDFVLLTLGTGIGSGIVYQGKLMEAAAEIGHMSINADGEKCQCGNNGCLELYAAAKAMKTKVISALESGTESLLKECCGSSFYKLTTEDIYKHALEGDNLSREALRDTGRYLGIGLANVINILSPEAIILAGGLIGAWNIYVQEAIKEASRRAFPELFENVQIIPSTLGDDAGIIGSAGLVFAAQEKAAEKRK